MRPVVLELSATDIVAMVSRELVKVTVMVGYQRKTEEGDNTVEYLLRGFVQVGANCLASMNFVAIDFVASIVEADLEGNKKDRSPCFLVLFSSSLVENQLEKKKPCYLFNLSAAAQNREEIPF